MTINDTIVNALPELTALNDTIENLTTTLTPNSSMFYRGMDKELQLLELEIRKGLRSFVIVGKNLATIQEKGLYKSRGFDSFEKYCKDTLDISRQQGYRLINASKIYAMLKDSYKGGKLPQSESQCRPLTDPDLSTLDVTLIWAIVVESGNITALSISKAIKQYRGDYSEPDKMTPNGDTVQAENLPFIPDTESSRVKVTETSKESENSENNATDTDTLPLIGVPELKQDTPDTGKVTPIGDTPADKKDTDKGAEVTNVSKGDLVAENLLLKAQVQELELKLLKAQNETKGTNNVPRSKMAILLYKAGFNVLLKSVTDDQKIELTELYNNLTGR